MTDQRREAAIALMAAAIRQAQDGFTADPSVMTEILEMGDVADYLAARAYDAVLGAEGERFCADCGHTAGKHTGGKRGGDSCDVVGCRCAALSEHPEPIVEAGEKKPNTTTSRCCNAPLRVDSADEGTSCYVCEKCGQPGDPGERPGTGEGEAALDCLEGLPEDRRGWTLAP